MVSVMTKKTEPKQEAGSTQRKAVLQMKGTEAWKGWLDRLAKYLRMPTSSVVDNALVEYAKSKGFPEEAPER